MNIDKQIDLNLNKLCNSETDLFDLTNFEALNGKRLTSKHKSETFAKKMESRGLIHIDGDYCFPSESGLRIFENGGWLQNSSFEKYTIQVLQKLRNGEEANITKSETVEVLELLKKLKNADIAVSIKNGVKVPFQNQKFLIKLIELQSWSEFLHWYDGQKNTDAHITYNITGSTIGQVNQSSSFSNSPQTANFTENSEPTTQKNFIKRFWELISGNKLISGIVTAIIVLLIKIIFGIEL